MYQSSVVQRFVKISQRLAIVALLLAAMPARADKTLMILVDWWLPQPMDTVINLRVLQPTSEIKMLDGSRVPDPTLTNAYTTEKRSWWYVLNKFNPDAYAMGRVRFNTLYDRGWYQNDSTYKVAAGDTAFFPDTQKTLQFQVTSTGVQTIVTLPTTGPKFHVFDAAATYRGPKLYRSQGNSGTEILNMRPQDSKGATLPGGLDKCIDTIPSDTIWLRWGTPEAPPGQQPSAAGMKCTGYNPFSTRAALVYLRNPWPGAEQPVVEFNGQNVPMFPSTDPDWLVADLRYIASNGVPPSTIRFKKSSGSNIYFDSAGLEQGAVMPFVLPKFGNANAYYFVPPEAGAPMVTGTVASGRLPRPSYTLYVQNPWKPGSPRLMWESDKSLHVMRPTLKCGWYSYPLYAAPTRVLIGHSFEDSVYGSKGLQFRVRENWIDIPASAIVTNGTSKEIWIQTMNASNARIPASATPTPVLKDCSTDQLKLVMKAYDFKGREESGGNPSFQIGGRADAMGAASSGLAKGMVLGTLGANGLPVYTGRDSGYQPGGINGQGKGIPYSGPGGYRKSTPTNWFDPVALKAAVPGIGIGQTCLELPLDRTPTSNGYFQFNDQNFFPLDTISDKAGYSLMKDAKSNDHNFLYCLHGHASFEYTPGLKFEFRGDDDVWVFINNKLAVDLGGVHGPESASVNLDKLKLREGTVYPFDIFYCERQTNGSSILIRTTMDLQPSWKYRADPSVVGGKLQVDILGQKSTNYVPSCADLNSGVVLPWEKTSGRMVVVGPEGSELNEIYNQDADPYDGNLIYSSAGQIIADTMKLKNNPKLMWPGTYTVRVESKLGDSLYAFTFTKLYGASNVTGLVLDGNGDGVADSIQLSTPRAVFADAPVYHLVWFKANGAKDSVILTAAQVRKVNDSLVIAPLSGKDWGVRTQLPAVKPDSLGAVVTTMGGIEVVNPIKLVDGIAPIADSARLGYGVNGDPDTLRIWASEASKENGAAAAGDVWAKIGSSTVPRNLVGGTYSSIDGGRGILLLLPATHGIGFSDSLRLAGRVSDLLGNAATNSSVWVPIRSNALGAASLYDNNGDGQADSLGVQVRGSLSGVASVKVSWKDAAGATVVKTWPLAGAVNGSFGVSGGGNAFPKGATSCLGGGCSVVFLDATGATIQTWPLIDSVAPMVLRGWYELGTTTDTLRVKFSEPITSISALPTWIEWGTAGAFAAILDHSTMQLVGTDSAYFVVDTAKGIRTTYDSIRLATGARAGKLKDQFGTPVGDNSPWAPITLGLPPMKVFLMDPGGLGRGTDIQVAQVRSVPASALASITTLRVVWSDTAGTSATRDIAFSALTEANGSWSGTLPTPFDFGATSCKAGGCQVVASSASAIKNWELVDRVPPTLVKAKYRYSGVGVNADTLILRASEPWVGANTGDLTPFALAGKSATSRSVNLKSWTMSADQLDQFVVLDSILATAYAMGDSARYMGGAAAKVVDALGNRPGDLSPWRLIDFGLRPPTLRLAPYPAMLDNSVKNGTAWEPPPPGTPASEIVVRPAKAVGSPSDSNKVNIADFVLPDGSPAKNDLTKVLGVKILLNRPLEGQLMIYDNIGTFVTSVDLAPMKQAWVADSANKDMMREVWMVWNGTIGNGKFAATGVYLFRAVVKVDNGDGTFEFRNLVWRLGWHRDAD